MGHEWGYIGDGKYQCRHCGMETDKGRIAADTATDCAGSPVPANISAELRENAEKIGALSLDLVDLVARIEALEEKEVLA